MIRGVAGLMVALGASACVNDPSVDYANDPSKIVLDPHTMFVTHGTEKQVFARLADERNRATPTEFQISNVSAGLTVRVDSTYRMDYINGDSLSWRPVQHQHRLWVGSTNPQGAMGTFTVTAQGISTTATARILPADLGSGLSSTSPGIGDVVTLTAPANVSFTDNATVAVVDGNTVVNAVVMDRAPKSISFVPFPGSTGVVRVAGVTLDYAPTLASRTLPTAATITVPEDPSSPSLSTTAPALGAPVTITAGPGQQFSSNSAVSFDPGCAAVVTARTATTLTILPRPGTGGAGGRHRPHAARAPQPAASRQRWRCDGHQCGADRWRGRGAGHLHPDHKQRLHHAGACRDQHPGRLQLDLACSECSGHRDRDG